MVEDDEEQMKEELKEAFRIYDKEVAKTFVVDDGRLIWRISTDMDRDGGKDYLKLLTLSNTILRFRDPMNSLWISNLFFFQCQGFITNDVLKDILREIDSTLTEEDLDHIVEEVDEDGSGTMDFDEFQEMMMG